MKRRRYALGASLVAVMATTALSASTAAFAAHHPTAPTAQAPKPIPKLGVKNKVLPDLQFLRTTSFQVVAKGLPGTASIGPSRPVSKPVPKGSPGDAPYAPPAYPTVPSLPITGNLPGVMTTTGATGYEQEAWGGYSLEPPDTEICANGDYVLQVVNNLLEVYDPTGQELSPPMPAEYFFSDFVNFVFDPKCYWDPDTAHWFVTWAVADFFGGSFSGVYIAVSQTANPLAPWNIYFLDTTDPFGNNGCFDDTEVACLGDQPLLGADKWTIQISTNEFPLVGGFNGGQMFFIDKTALALGLPSPNVVGIDFGDVATPDGDCPTDSSGAPCWYSVQPAESSNANYALGGNGTAFALSALDFFGVNDDRIAVWAFTNTKSISSFSPSLGGFLGVLDTGAYGMPPFAAQAEGDNPLGEAIGIDSVRDIQTNDDRMNEVDYNHRTGWLMGGLNTGACVVSCGHFRAGIAWFGFRLQYIHGSLLLIGQKGGYIANATNDTLFPASTTANSGNGIWVYTLTGGSRYPSAAFSTFSNTANPSRIHVSHPGVGPQDGFTEYSDFFFDSYRPRWGDYSGAVTTGNRSYWSTEFIDQTCTFAEWDSDPSCGGERGLFINWANSIAGAVTP